MQGFELSAVGEKKDGLEKKCNDLVKENVTIKTGNGRELEKRDAKSQL